MCDDLFVSDRIGIHHSIGISYNSRILTKIQSNRSTRSSYQNFQMGPLVERQGDSVPDKINYITKRCAQDRKTAKPRTHQKRTENAPNRTFSCCYGKCFIGLFSIQTIIDHIT